MKTNKEIEDFLRKKGWLKDVQQLVLRTWGYSIEMFIQFIPNGADKLLTQGINCSDELWVDRNKAYRRFLAMNNN